MATCDVCLLFNHMLVDSANSIPRVPGRHIFGKTILAANKQFRLLDHPRGRAKRNATSTVPKANGLQLPTLMANSLNSPDPPLDPFYL